MLKKESDTTPINDVERATSTKYQMGKQTHRFTNVKFYIDIADGVSIVEMYRQRTYDEDIQGVTSFGGTYLSR